MIARLSYLRTLLRNEHIGSGRFARSRDELEFLPAALEVLETPASPLGRSVALMIGLLMILLLVWAYWGEIDTVAVARGKLVPGGQVKVVQPIELGVVRAIHVTDGQHVNAGQLLVELDPTESEVSKDRIIQALNDARIEARRLEVTLRRLEGEPAELLMLPDTDPIRFREQQHKLQADLNEYRARLAALESERRQVEAQYRAGQAEVARLQALLPIVEEQEQAFRTLMEQKVGARLRWLDARRDLIEQQQDLAVQQHQLQELNAMSQAIQDRSRQLQESFRKSVVGERLNALEQIAQAELELKSAETRERRNRLLSPVDGVVEALAVHTVGGVVRPADELMKIVPDDAPLEVEAMLLNKDVGFVHQGQKVEVKVDSFPFTKYGVIDGEVLKLSSDAKVADKQGLIYPVRVSIDKSSMHVDDYDVALKSGMAVSAEIKTGRRKLIEFFLAPFLRYTSESLRER
ncbi:HlyD family type I secretion periplasmic adaptor subunit [Marinobacterium zhoushanense]|uniref:Membrane fusion protein (MFP) family protein n=1 Tax=Marinobacterium zhoushanense TaxID=1679163 RepID=A0ABQ1KLI1_9GAMM|nr:HlyD family type I secretion periplasmic adaptor subunit [Marinobacterium zhoushanense]GGC04060.1 HlyD family type I secretion periplasmic adaptor subunit [Marinobacterium zhoushanense]